MYRKWNEAERMSSDSWMEDRLNWNTSLPCETPEREKRHWVKDKTDREKFNMCLQLVSEPPRNEEVFIPQK